MKYLFIILSITLCMTTPASAKILWECNLKYDGQNFGRITRFKDTLVLIFNTGDVFEHTCINSESNRSKVLDVCMYETENNDPSGQGYLGYTHLLATFIMEKGLPKTFDWVAIEILDGSYKSMDIDDTPELGCINPDNPLGLIFD